LTSSTDSVISSWRTEGHGISLFGSISTSFACTKEAVGVGNTSPSSLHFQSYGKSPSRRMCGPATRRSRADSALPVINSLRKHSFAACFSC
jgi:hypothetical protein